MKDASERTEDDIEAILDFLLHFPVRILLGENDDRHAALSTLIRPSPT